MSKRLSVGNLPHQMTGEQLQTLFSEAGLVASARVITYLHNGQTCGFGFVAMETQEESQKAISMFNGRLVDGRLLAVKEDWPQSKCSFGRRSRNSREPLASEVIVREGD
ncbi:MAG: RNA-binding protein [Desulfobaccales bacterium]